MFACGNAAKFTAEKYGKKSPPDLPKKDPRDAQKKTVEIYGRM